jgi:hypothetical protein
MKLDEDFDSNIVFGSLKKVSGNYFIPIGFQNENTTEKMYFQFDKLSFSQEQVLSDESKVIDTQINEHYTEWIREMEELLCEKTKENLDLWFPGKGLTESYVDTAFMGSLKNIKKSHESIFRLRTSPDLCVFNSDKTEIEKEDVQIGSRFSTIIHLAGLWFTNTRFGITWKVEQILIKSKSHSSSGECLFNDESDDDDDIQNVFPDE